MRTHRRARVVVVVVGLVLALAAVTTACGTPGDQPAGSSTSGSVTRTPARGTSSTLPDGNCLELGKAASNLTSTSDPDEAAAAAGAIDAYGPPQEVIDANVVLVEAADASAIGPEVSEAQSHLFAWIGAVCP